MAQQNRNSHEWQVRPKEIKKWIGSTFDKETILYAEDFGKYLVKERLTTSQIRNIFGEVKRLQGTLQGKDSLDAKIKKDFLMLRPKLAYAAKRAGSRGIDALKDVLDNAHKAVDLEGKHLKKQFENFVDFFEAILAYHKAAGGRD